MKHERRMPAWLLRDLPALAGMFVCFWLFVIPLITEGFRIVPAGSSEAVLTYTSVHAFKGMENKVIIVTDLNLGAGDTSRALFYTALTRATESVFILCRTEDAQQLISWNRLVDR